MNDHLFRTLVVVVPHKWVKAMRARGFVANGRRNGFTQTMARQFVSAEQAMAAGRQLGNRFVWGMEA